MEYEDSDQCRVAEGEWDGPYTGEQFTDPSDLDVDHMVPLANAHRSGGWACGANRRKRQYANDLSYAGSPDSRAELREPRQGRRRAGGVETSRSQILVPVCHRLDYDKEHLEADRDRCGGGLPVRDAEHLHTPKDAYNSQVGSAATGRRTYDPGICTTASCHSDGRTSVTRPLLPHQLPNLENSTALVKMPKQPEKRVHWAARVMAGVFLSRWCPAQAMEMAVVCEESRPSASTPQTTVDRANRPRQPKRPSIRIL